MAQKRKLGALKDVEQGDSVYKPPVGTKTFTSGPAVRDGLAPGARQAFVAFNQQILTLHSDLPLPITHQTVVLLQHYIQVSPTVDEIFDAWRNGDRSRNEGLVQAAVSLLVQIIQILTPLPFFRTSVLAIIKKLLTPSDPYHELLNRMIQSAKREHAQLGLHLAAVAIHVDPPNPAAGPSGGSSGRIAGRVWTALVEGGTAKMLGKTLNLRRRNKEGVATYGNKDPLDKPDIRHAALHLILPLLSLPTFQTYTKQILPQLYSNLSGDPPATIYRILNALWAAIIGPSGGVGRRNALTYLDEKALENLLGLLSREDVEQKTGKTVADMTMAFLEGVTTVPGQGICFPDEGWYPRTQREDKKQENDRPNDQGDRFNAGAAARKGLHNRILSNATKRVGAKVVEGQGRVGEWVIKVLTACPELVAGYWAYSALSLDPRLDARWLATISYVGRIIALPIPDMATFHEPVPKGFEDATSVSPARSSPPAVETIVESILPSPLGKVHLTKGLQHADGLIQHVTALGLVKALQKLDAVLAIFDTLEAELKTLGGPEADIGVNEWIRCRQELEMECRRRAPDVLVVIAFAQKSATLARVPADSDDDPNPTLVARSAILTEAALRILRLYHRTLPSIGREARFDVGKLLVSGSSAKAERREKREGREGSVISETGSVGSFGTVGTIGMGGGFGQGRGELSSFDALCQIHVLCLLADVKDWQWTAKASGSQYSYLYHILILHSSTPHPVTKEMTTRLLNKILLPTTLFEHDHGELQIWLKALPALSGEIDVQQRVFLVAQQIHLLSFIDECVRRCMKTPYKYIDDVLNVIPDYFTPTRKAHELVTPLMMTMLEQLNAKILGQHMSTEAACVVVGYLDRVFLGLVGKARNGDFLLALAGKLSALVVEARAKGQERKGLNGSITPILSNLGQIFGRTMEQDPNLEAEERVGLIDNHVWLKSSAERALLVLVDESADVDAQAGVVAAHITAASPPAVERYGRFVTHLLGSGPVRSEAKTYLLANLTTSLKRSTGVHADRLRESAFSSSVIKDLLLGTQSETCDPTTIDTLVVTLRRDAKVDQVLAEEYLHDLLEKIVEDKKGKALPKFLSLLHPWTRFLHDTAAKRAIELIVKNMKRLKEVDSRTKSTIGTIILATDDIHFALNHVESFVPIGIIEPFTELIKSTSTRRQRLDATPGIQLSVKVIEALLEFGGNEGLDLVTALVEVVPVTIDPLVTAFKARPEVLDKKASLPIVQYILELRSDGDLPIDRIVTTAVKTLSSPTQVDVAAGEVLSSICALRPEVVEEGIKVVTPDTFTPQIASWAAKLATVDSSYRTMGTITHVVHTSLQRLSKACSGTKPLEEEHLEIMKHIRTIVETCQNIDLNIDLVESIITIITQDRLTVPAATELAAVLSQRCILKASFIRQMLGMLFAAPIYSKVASTSESTILARPGYVKLISALFQANPYISCQPNFVEQLLPLYKGTLSPSDQSILGLFQVFEGYRRLSVGSVLNKWSSSGMGSGGRAFDSLIGLDSNKILATSLAFPLRRTLREQKTTSSSQTSKVQVEETEETELYDPSFVLPLFNSVLQEENTGLDWVEILRSNILGLVVASLSSRNEEMRALGGFLLSKTTSTLKTVAFHEKPQLVYLLRLVRHAVPAPALETENDGSKKPSAPRFPTLISHFLVHAFRSLAQPANPLYADISRFLLQRPIFDAADVPMLFGMLYASGDSYKRDRSWIVRYIRDGTRCEADWRLLKRRKTVDLLQTIYNIAVDTNYRKLILQAFEQITLLRPAALSLAHRSRFIPWLSSQWLAISLSPTRSTEEEKSSLLTILENLLVMLIDRQAFKDGMETAKDDEDEKPAEEEIVLPGGLIRGKEWILEAEKMLERALEDCDVDRVAVLTRIALRLSSFSSSTSAIRLLPKLTKRLCALYPTPTSTPTYVKIVEELFQISLELPSQGIKHLQTAVEEVGWRTSLLDSEVGVWVRREQRQGAWDLHKQRSD